MQLTCEREEWLTRLQSPQRGPHHKITDPRIAFGLMERFDPFSPMPFEPHLTVDTTGRQPADVAREIVAALSG